MQNVRFFFFQDFFLTLLYECHWCSSPLSLARAWFGVEKSRPQSTAVMTDNAYPCVCVCVCGNGDE